MLIYIFHEQPGFEIKFLGHVYNKQMGVKYITVRAFGRLAFNISLVLHNYESTIFMFLLQL